MKRIGRNPLKRTFIKPRLQFAFTYIKFVIAENSDIHTGNIHSVYHLPAADALPFILQAVINRGADKITGHHQEGIGV